MEHKYKIQSAEPIIKFKDEHGTLYDYFWIEEAVKLFLDKQIMFVNSRKYLDYQGKEQPETLVLFVICNDVFAWGCADAEEITSKEVEDLYKCFCENETWGSTIWCMKKRNQLPQVPVIEAMKKDGVWKDEFDNLGKVKTNENN